MNASRNKILKRILWTILIITLVPLVSMIMEMAHKEWLDWKYPYGVCETEFYEVSDTIIQTPAGGIDAIPLQNLPVRNLSFGEIMQRFGSRAVVRKEAECYASGLPYIWSRFPRETAEKCAALGNKQIYSIELQYDDGSDEILTLFVYESLNEIQILWGYRNYPYLDANSLE